LVTRYYRRNGWTVLRFWEHTLAIHFDACVEQVLSKIKLNGSESP
jgi:very-short-patch-repair endonuclease